MRRPLLIPTGRTLIQDVLFFWRNYTISIIIFTLVATFLSAVHMSSLVILGLSLLIAVYPLAHIYILKAWPVPRVVPRTYTESSNGSPGTPRRPVKLFGSLGLLRQIIFSLVFGLLVYMALALYSDWQELTRVLAKFPWSWLPVVVVLTWVNYLSRLLKWQWYLRLLGVEIPQYDSARIFGVGMLLGMTPGKAGEFLKSYMVRNVTGTPMSITAPAVLAERMVDSLAMLVLTAVGLFAFPYPTARWAAGIMFVVLVIFIGLIQFRPLALSLLDLGRQLPIVNRFARHLFGFYVSSYIFFKLRNLLIALSIGVISWGVEGIAYYLVLVGLGITPNSENVLIAMFIFGISTIIGDIFATPNGLGGVEGSLIFLSASLFGLTTAQATSGVLIIRFCTLWMGVTIGLISFVLWSHLLGSFDISAPSDESRYERNKAEIARS